MIDLPRALLLLAAAALASSLSVGALTSRLSPELRQLQANFRKINAHLEAKVGKDSADVAAIQAEAAEWLSSLKQTPQGQESDLIGSLELFLSLGELEQSDSATCNARGHEIISANTRALGDLARYGLRPVDKVAQQCMEAHARACCPRYSAAFERAASALSEQVKRRVSTFSESMAKFALERGNFQLTFGAKTLNDLVGRHPLVYILLLDDTSKGSEAVRRDRPSELLAMGRILQENHRAEKLPTDRAALGGLLREHLLGPCQQFAKQIGPDVYEPLEGDLNISLDSRGRVAACETDSREFKLGMAQYKMCTMYLLDEDHEQLLDGLLSSLASAK